ncbi:MAG: trypsin-like serine protease [Deltaproteobacteria bacterium]|nr:trypsin-like serine protease [Deltaproteobacteria bacterium]
MLMLAVPARAQWFCCVTSNDDWVEPEPPSPTDVVVVVDRSSSVTARYGIAEHSVLPRLEAVFAARTLSPTSRIHVISFPVESRASHNGEQVFTNGARVEQTYRLDGPWGARISQLLRDKSRSLTPLADGIDLGLGQLAALGPGASLIVVTDGIATGPKGEIEVGEAIRASTLARLNDFADRVCGVFLDPTKEDLALARQTPGAALRKVSGIRKCGPKVEAPIPTAPVGEPALRLDPVPLSSSVLVGDEQGYRCSGVLVSERAVLTAAHCLPATRVRLGGLEAMGRETPVSGWEPHPEATIDLAMLALSSEGGHAALRRGVGDATPPLGRLQHVGFGIIAEQTTPFGRLHPRDILAVGWGCDGRADALRRGCRPGIELAVPGARGADTCDGDSGGPLYELVSERTPEGVGRPFVVEGARELPFGSASPWSEPASEGRSECLAYCAWQVVGITSRPIAGARRRCGDGGIYTRVDAQAGWVDEVIRRFERRRYGDASAVR